MKRPTWNKPFVTRRTFIAGSLAIAGGLGALGLYFRGLAGKSTRPSAEGSISLGAKKLKAAIRERFDYLEFDDEVVLAFVRDRERIAGRLHAKKRLGDAVFDQFLMSTDFFQQGADESSTLHYVAYYDPYATPCYNPLMQA